MFNPAAPTVMHVDINSCFATVEQQANPSLRGKPMVVAAYAQNHGCILAASIEAKKLGIKTGMRVWEGKKVYRNLVVLPPDPDKYRFVNRALRVLLGHYTPDLSVESIDEMVMKMPNEQCQMLNIAKEIKERIKYEIGEWITVSIGIAPNRYLAKIASGLHKPDGLDVITGKTIVSILEKLQLEDLCGIKSGNATRLRIAGIYTPLAFFQADEKTLRRAFRSIVGRHWWMRMHGYEDGSMYKAFGSGQDEQKSFGQSHALGKPLLPTDPQLWQVLSQLVVKMGGRLRKEGFTARGIGVLCMFDYPTHWGTREMVHIPLYADSDFYHRMHALILKAPLRPVRNLAIHCYQLEDNLYKQQSLLESDTKKEQMTKAVDAVTARWGSFAIMPGRMLDTSQKVLDRIAFGRIRELSKSV